MLRIKCIQNLRCPRALSLVQKQPSTLLLVLTEMDIFFSNKLCATTLLYGRFRRTLNLVKHALLVCYGISGKLR